MNRELFVNFATKYAELGWSVYPVQPIHDGICTCHLGAACSDAGKHPYHELGGVSAASSQPKHVKAIFSGSNANIGLLCGDRFFVVDCDGAAGVAEFDRLIAEMGGLSRTPVAETGGGGRHYFFAADSRVKNRTKIGGSSIDAKAAGGMVVVAPSLHKSGSEYRWVEAPWECPLATAPEQLIAFLTDRQTSSPISGTTFTVEDLDLRTAAGVSEGARNTTLCRLIGSHLAQYGDTPDLLQRATEWGQRCDPPLSDGEIEKVVVSLVNRHLTKQHAAPATFSGLTATPFAAIEAKPVDWLWPGRLARGKLTLLTGDGGVGKSILTCYLAARISRGEPFPDGAACKAGDSFFIGAEDGAEDTVRPRLDAAGAVVSRVHFVSGPKPSGKDFASPVDLSIHIHKLEELLAAYPNAALLVIDPVMDYLGEQTNTDKAAHVRQILGPLRSLAERHHVAVVLINHLNKSARGPKSRSLGSGAFNHVCRVELRVVEDPANASRRLLLPVKTNLVTPMGLAYRIEASSNDAGVALWEPEPVHITIDEVEGDDGGEVKGAIAEACDWLRAHITDGPVRSSELVAGAARDGISHSTLKRAKAKLRIDAGQRARQWWWSLPEAENAKEAEPSVAESQNSSVQTEGEGTDEAHVDSHADDAPPTADEAGFTF